MVKFNSMRVVTSTPAPILRRRGMSSELVNSLLDLGLDEDNSLEISTNTSNEHKAAQRSVNVIMKKLRKTHPDYTFVTRTVRSGKDEMVLGVYRVD